MRRPAGRSARPNRRVLAVVLIVGLLAVSPAPLQRSTAGAQASDAATAPPEAAIAPLAATDPTQFPALDAGAVAARIVPLLGDPALGPDPGSAVLDADTGEVLFGGRPQQPLIPASSLKVITALAVLDSQGPQQQLATSVVRNPDGTLVLLGGGDPSLLTVPAEDPAAYPNPATLADLAEQTAAALAAEGVAEVDLRHDSTLFTGPALLPDWDPDFVPLGIISPVSALTVDPESAQIDQGALDADPAAAAAGWFAARLAGAGIAVASVAAGRADPQAEPLASVASPPLSALVDRMLDISDNDYAEALLRLAAIGRGLPGDFASGVAAATATLADLDIPVPGLVLRDGSGLSRENRIAPITLAAALQVAADPLPEVADGRSGDAAGEDGAAAADVLTWAPPGLAVGGLTGSLAGRYDDDETVAGAGRVRAKTGTLTGVTSLTGVVSTQQGRPVVFTVLGNGTGDTVAAREALDRVAAALAECGCTAPGA
jgi:D-alanyl-D-alanine carboxypeptidase/D-alanyl-D-alanine-endopeptidase (penicillin-binding protein 4)